MKLLAIVLLISTLPIISRAQQSTNSQRTTSNGTIKWAPTGLIVGSFSLQGEYAFKERTSFTAKIGFPAAATYSTNFDHKDADFKLKATSFMAGYRMYLSQQQLKGIYIEPFFKFVHHSAEGVGNSTLGIRNVSMSFSNDYDAFGVGAQLGAQFRIAHRFVIDLFLIGPEINTANSNFKAREISNTIPWNTIEAQDAERQVKDFIDKFPFIRNHTTIMVNKEDQTVLANFKGALPGFRTGVSIGFSF